MHNNNNKGNNSNRNNKKKEHNKSSRAASPLSVVWLCPRISQMHVSGSVTGEAASAPDNIEKPRVKERYSIAINGRNRTKA